MKNFFESFPNFLIESMSDEEGLIKAIFDNPLDTTGYLVYADWLDENNIKFGNLVRAAVASANPETSKKKDPKEESFFNMLKNKYANNFEGYGLLNVNFKQGTFGYRNPSDSMQWTVYVLPTGQIMAKTQDIDKSSSGTQYQPINVDQIEPIEGKRTALLMLIEEMVDSHRLVNPHGHGSNYRRDKKIGDDEPSDSVWIDHATHSVELAIRWFIDLGRMDYNISEMVDGFKEVIAQYMIPLEKMSRGMVKEKYKTNSTEFKKLTDWAIRIATNIGVCDEDEQSCKEFSRLAKAIYSRMQF